MSLLRRGWARLTRPAEEGACAATFDPRWTALVFAAAFALDALLAEPLTPIAIASAAGLGTGLALALSAAMWIAARLPRPVTLVAAAAAGVTLARHAIIDLNAIARFEQEPLRAGAALVVGSGAGLVAFSLIAAAAPARAAPVAWAARFTDRRRRFFWLSTLAALAALSFDRLAFPFGYPGAHFVARVLFTIALSCATAFAHLPPLPRGIRAWRSYLPLGLACVPFVLLGHLPSNHSHALLDRPLPRFALSLYRGAVDVDRDGYAGLLGGGDCAPLDPRVFPGARDVPDNGVDENCLFGDRRAPAAETLAEPPARGRKQRDDAARSSVVLITIDSLRPDRLGSYGHSRATSPNLDRFADSALVFDRAYTSGGWTSLALSSLMRGVWARRLRWSAVRETNRMRLMPDAKLALKPGEFIARTFSLPLLDERATLGDLLRKRQIASVAVLDDGATGYFRKDLGAFAGFGVTRLTDQKKAGERGDPGTTDLAIRELAKLSGKHFFLWVHYFGVHGPVSQHDDAPLFGDSALDRYDHEIAHADRHIGRLLEAIAASPAADSIAVIVASDHGEEFFGDRRNHGLSLREGAIRIPLLLRAPGLAAGRCAEPASLVDVSATIVALTGADVPAHFDGQDLRKLCELAPARALFVDTWRFDHLGRTYLDAVAALDARGKITHSFLDSDRAAWMLDGPAERYVPDETSLAELRSALNGLIEQTGTIVLEE